MASNGFSHRIVVPVPRPRVWDELQEATTWEALSGVREIFDVEHDEHGHLAGYRWIAVAGPRHIEGTARVSKCREPTSMVLDVDAGEFTGVIDARLREPAPRSTSLAVSLRLEAHGIVASLVLPLLSQVVGSGLSRQMEVFGERLVEGA